MFWERIGFHCSFVGNTIHFKGAVVKLGSFIVDAVVNTLISISRLNVPHAVRFFVGVEALDDWSSKIIHIGSLAATERLEKHLRTGKPKPTNTWTETHL